MIKTCRQCLQSFEITPDDLQFYDKISPVFDGKKFPMPPPALCPYCRQIRRLLPMNEINLYMRKCDATGKDILSNYHSSWPYKVYEQPYWWSDQWDPLQYGRDFDFSRPFFEQFKELSIAVPRPNLFTTYLYDENCAYTNNTGKNKNCYLIFDSDYCRDTYYSYSMNHATNCIDGHRVRQSELCYENIDCKQCYNCKYTQNSTTCSDSAFLDDCLGCKKCFMSFNVQHKEYYIYNRQGTKEQYETLMQQLSSRQNVEKFKEEFKIYKAKCPKKYLHGIQNENVTGDYLSNCKNVFDSFDCNDAWDCKHLYQSFGTGIKNSMDLTECGELIQLLYENSSGCGYNATNIKFSVSVLDQCSDILYGYHCHFSNNLFVCIGLRRKKYCIFNKQYTAEEYGAMVAKIIEHIQKTGEWGEFFPASFSPFGYNETMAMDYAPLTKEQALAKGYRWLDDDKKKLPATYTPSDDIKTVPETILKEILGCSACGANFRIIPQELKFYRTQLIPIPSKCFKCRYYERLRSRNPRRLWARNCGKCGVGLQTSYSPERPEQIYCEKCYLAVVF